MPVNSSPRTERDGRFSSNDEITRLDARRESIYEEPSPNPRVVWTRAVVPARGSFDRDDRRIAGGLRRGSSCAPARKTCLERRRRREKPVTWASKKALTNHPPH